MIDGKLLMQAREIWRTGNAAALDATGSVMDAEMCRQGQFDELSPAIAFTEVIAAALRQQAEPHIATISEMMNKYADLHEDLRQITNALYKPLVDLAAMSPRAIAIKTTLQDGQIVYEPINAFDFYAPPTQT